MGWRCPIMSKEKINSQQFCEEKVESEITIGEVSSSHSWVGPSPSHSSLPWLPGISHDLSTEARWQPSPGLSRYHCMSCKDFSCCDCVCFAVCFVLIVFFLCVLWLLVVNQGLNVHPRLIASSQPSYISFQSNSMPNSYCLRQTYWDKLLRDCLMQLAMSGRTKTMFCIISWVSIFMILSDTDSLGIPVQPKLGSHLNLVWISRKP